VAIFASKAFRRFARRAKLEDVDLIRAAAAVTEGHCDADLGGGVFKQRIARRGGGKSGGLRTIVLFKLGGHCFFVHGFAKNAKANIAEGELSALRTLASVLLTLDDRDLEHACAAGELIRISGHDEVDIEERLAPIRPRDRRRTASRGRR
jgi:hypothetical protein